MDTVSIRHRQSPLAREPGLNEDTFTHLYQGQLGPVFNYVRYRLGAGEAEDVTAEIFARAWTRRRRYDPSKGSAKAWLWAIARNAVTDRLRRRRRRPRQVELPPDLAALGEPSAALSRQEAWRQVRAALAQLQPLDQEIIALRFGAGRTNRAIAALLSLSEANVAQRLRRALRRMRVHLESGELPGGERR